MRQHLQRPHNTTTAGSAMTTAGNATTAETAANPQPSTSQHAIGAYRTLENFYSDDVSIPSSSSNSVEEYPALPTPRNPQGMHEYLAAIPYPPPPYPNPRDPLNLESME
jgi:hypothetical protein